MVTWSADYYVPTFHNNSYSNQYDIWNGNHVASSMWQQLNNNFQFSPSSVYNDYWYGPNVLQGNPAMQVNHFPVNTNVEHNTWLQQNNFFNGGFVPYFSGGPMQYPGGWNRPPSPAIAGWPYLPASHSGNMTWRNSGNDFNLFNFDLNFIKDNIIEILNGVIIGSDDLDTDETGNDDTDTGTGTGTDTDTDSTDATGDDPWAFWYDNEYTIVIDLG